MHEFAFVLFIVLVFFNHMDQGTNARYIAVPLNSPWPSDAIWRLSRIWVNAGPGNGLLPDGTKSLPEPMLTYPKYGLMTFIWGQFHERYLSQWPLKSAWNLLIWNLLWISQGFNSSRFWWRIHALTVISLAPSPWLNQCWLIITVTPRNKLRLTFDGRISIMPNLQTKCR